MLPILRLIPVGGVLLAILILLLALDPPTGPRPQFAADMGVARGALLVQEQHPEWRQMLILAALRRADALRSLRDLPDTPTRMAPLLPNEAAQRAASHDTEIASVQQPAPAEDDVTGSVQTPDAGMPVDIGAASQFELPVIPHDELPPAVMIPALRIPEIGAPPTEPAASADKAAATVATPRSEMLALPPVDVISLIPAKAAAAQAKPASCPAQANAAALDLREIGFIPAPAPAASKLTSLELSPNAAAARAEAPAAVPIPTVRPPIEPQIKKEGSARAPAPPRKAKLASREDVPVRVKPDRKATRQGAKPGHAPRNTHRMRRSRTRHTAQTNPVPGLFGAPAMLPGGYVAPTTP